jgi:hypothetical protein
MKIKGIFILCVILALGLGLAAVPVGTAGIHAPTDFFGIIVQGEATRNPEYVRVIDQRLDLTTLRLDTGWKDRSTPKPERWSILGTKIKTSIGRAYLAYDPSGKDSRVYLSRKAGPGTDWQFGKQDKKDHDLLMAVPQAASGKVKGWYLGAEEYEDKSGAVGQPETAFRLVLCKERTKAKVYVFRVYAYRSTAR